MKRIDSLLMTARDFKVLTAADCMEQDVVYYHPDATGSRMATALVLGGFGSVPIVNQDKVVIGIVSEFDLLLAIMEGRALDRTTAEAIMTRDPVCVRNDTKAMEIVTLLEKRHLIRVPVTDKQGRLVGIVARRDLLLGYLKARKAQPAWW